MARTLKTRQNKKMTLTPYVPERSQDAITKFIKKNKEASYRILQDHFKHVPESSLRRHINNLIIDDVIEKKQCLCGQGFIFSMKKK